jgi:hypothetical protein
MREGFEYRLLEEEPTKEKGGGMGWSWRGWANMEESDFPTEDNNEARDETPPPTPPESFSKQNGRI